MNFRAVSLFIYCFLFVSVLGLAQTIKGEVLDKETKKPLDGVSITEVYTSLQISTGTDGSFLIATGPDHLIEFKKPGYKTARARIPVAYSPNFYRIILEKGYEKPKSTQQKQNGRYNYHDDSASFYSLYKHQLEMPKLSGVDAVAHPFTALSKQYRETRKFQIEYDYYEHEKYVDKTFNPELIQHFTGLTGDSLTRYIRRFRPQYDDLIEMNDYTFYNYIKKTTTRFREGESRNGAQ